MNPKLKEFLILHAKVLDQLSGPLEQEHPSPERVAFVVGVLNRATADLRETLSLVEKLRGLLN